MRCRASGLPFGWDGVDVRSIGGRRNLDSGLTQPVNQIIDEIRGLAGTLIAEGVLDYIFE